MALTAARVMSHNVVSVLPDAGVAEIAALLAKHAVSAAPVIDRDGRLLGMVSEGDLMQPFAPERQAKRAWWLDMLAEGETLAPEFVQYVSLDHHCARDLMTRDVVTAPLGATLPDIAALLVKHKVKRVPIMDGGRVAGIVSRADIVRALANPEAMAA